MKNCGKSGTLIFAAVTSLVSLVVLLHISVLAGQQAENTTGSFTDPRDGEVYKWVRIGNQVWMAENLRFEPDSGSWCWENKEDNCKSRGRFYNWTTAIKVSPPGWHLPSDEEWKTLETALGLTTEQVDQEGLRIDRDSLLAGKIKLSDGWPKEYQGRAIVISNETGFSALNTGFYGLGEFTHEGYTSWWSSTDVDSTAWIRHIGFFANFIGRVLNNKEHAFSVRCVRDENPSGNAVDK